MKKTISILLAALMLMTVLIACGGKASNPKGHVFNGSFAPALAGVDPIQFRLEMKEDGTLTLTPGTMLNTNSEGAIISDDPGTGTWSEDEKGVLTFTIKAAGDEDFVTEYTVEKMDGYYEFDMMLSLAGYKRPIVMTSSEE